MAKKKNKTLVKLASSEGTGVFYVREKNNKAASKLEFSKYDKKLRKHVRFNEKKLSS
jgi:large subunit ribosomal protein L33